MIIGGEHNLGACVHDPRGGEHNLGDGEHDWMSVCMIVTYP